MTTGGLAEFIKNGGRLFYVLVEENPDVYEAWCIRPDGRKDRVYVSLGPPKSFKSGTALIAFHKKFMPDDDFVPVPLKCGVPESK